MTTAKMTMPQSCAILLLMLQSSSLIAGTPACIASSKGNGTCDEFLVPAIGVDAGTSCTASSELNKDYGCSKAYDGAFGDGASGAPGKGAGKAWASKGQGAGSWIKLKIPEKRTIDTMLYTNRRSAEDSENNEVILQFSDGKPATVMLKKVALNDHSFYSYCIPKVTTAFVKIVVVSHYTQGNNGADEIAFVHSNGQCPKMEMKEEASGYYKPASKVGNIPKGEVVPTTKGKCVAKCAADAACKAWNFKPEFGMCHLKGSTAPGFQPDPAWIAGEKGEPEADEDRMLATSDEISIFSSNESNETEEEDQQLEKSNGSSTTSSNESNATVVEIQMETLHWSFTSIVMCTLFACVCLFIPYLCAGNVGGNLGGDLVFNRCRFKVLPSWIPADSLVPLNQDDSIITEVQGEAALALVLPYATAACTYWTAVTCGKGVSQGTSYALMAILGTRAFAKDIELTRRRILKEAMSDETASATIDPLLVTVCKDLKRFPACPLFMSKLELVDAISDGAAWAAVRLLEATPEFNARLIYAWSHGGWMSQQVVVGIEQLGLSGCMLVSLGGAFVAQWGTITERSVNSKDWPARTADVAGLGGLADTFGKQEFAVLYLTAARVIAEGLPQLLWQSSAIMAMNRDILSSPMLLVSLTLSLGSTGKKGFDLLKMGTTSYACHLGLIILLSVAYFSMKLFMTQMCPEHSWNLAFPPMQGCVDFPF